MELFTLKKNHQLQWDDIPFIETPAFAREHALDAIRYGDKIWKRVTNIKEFVAEEIGHFNPCGNNCQTELKVYDLFHQGTYFSVAHHKPFAPAFTWKPDAHHPNQGEWVMQNPWVYPTFVKEQIDRITTRHKKVLAEAYLSELQATPFAIAQAAVEEQIKIPMAKVSSAIAAPSIASAQPEPITAEKPTPAYRVLKGKYGTLHDYGDHIVHWDIRNFNNSPNIISSYTLKNECYTLGDGFGLPTTNSIAPGRKLTDFGEEIPDGTIFATFVENEDGDLVYPSSKNKTGNISGHLFVYDKNQGGLSEDRNSVTVYHQYKRGVTPNLVHKAKITGNTSNLSVLEKHLDKYYAVTIK